MQNKKLIRGFSKRNKEERIDFLIERLGLTEQIRNWLYTFESDDSDFQRIIDELSENPVSNYHMPFCIAPNFLVNGVSRTFPLVTEESSVVAALGKAAAFWAERGGFHTEITGTEKKGQVHFKWKGNPEKLAVLFPGFREKLMADSFGITARMEARGGGITSLELRYLPEILPDYYQLDVSFETLDAMGANFINSVLEKLAESLLQIFAESGLFSAEEKDCEIIMAILSNHTPGSRVKVWTECPVSELAGLDGTANFAEKFTEAVHIAQNDVSRAVTHNKGILNGIDALSIATGNDFRAIEAGVHAFAARNGKYASLSHSEISNGQFRFEMEIPLAVGVVGGTTAVHPLAKFALRILDDPSAKELMGYLAVAGLASNFAAIRALITSGIQRGHMKMHLSNILSQLQVSENERAEIQKHFADKTVSYSEVENFLNKKRNAKTTS
ncbi:MAG: hydroxymethylglutaryl-CoA reductase, degradative [Bacteroidetes bacterium GWF2_42_66]|nr:MAG: hydroxymethylglutaryl-CoA reductase, degradative [Bacteroidetes bacterium GWA2_42_15]OFY02100.1 MAG: hydroxymethylglutaryl-CoA reductase, degradative [Bacteroidetes bacterium GWE2_42_39]OFY43447.1 MAG: hydroxymethylglutaryl-CoA reductase, degradative [Bacteroidetes bacterium GWF2_42_66]HBL76531.1 hydroxymethylglutaryl-CoA reductase, degradative [Prolixibacteraceae bacterium]HCR92269.1 hydroxymethylglutaryl-CoA reductase, degradative [Prolixibacteraceae bacterium]